MTKRTRTYFPQPNARDLFPPFPKTRKRTKITENFLRYFPNDKRQEPPREDHAAVCFSQKRLLFDDGEPKFPTVLLRADVVGRIRLDFDARGHIFAVREELREQIFVDAVKRIRHATLNGKYQKGACGNGDDFKLLYVIPMSAYETFRHDFQTFSIIGHLAKPDVGAVLVTPEGAELPVHAQGWPKDEE